MLNFLIILFSVVAGMLLYDKAKYIFDFIKFKIEEYKLSKQYNNDGEYKSNDKVIDDENSPYNLKNREGIHVDKPVVKDDGVGVGIKDSGIGIFPSGHGIKDSGCGRGKILARVPVVNIRRVDKVIPPVNGNYKTIYALQDDDKPVKKATVKKSPAKKPVKKPVRTITTAKIVKKEIVKPTPTKRKVGRPKKEVK